MVLSENQSCECRKKQAEPKTRYGAPASMIRGALIDALDRSFCDGELGQVLWQKSDNEQLQRHGIEVFQAVTVALFPEEFGVPGQVGICPKNGPRRAGNARMVAFLQTLEGSK